MTVTDSRQCFTVMSDSPIGPLILVAEEGRLTGVHWKDGSVYDRPYGERADDDALLLLTRAQLDEYFAGERQEFDLPLAPKGTDFQRRVWAALVTIPYAQVWSYGALARIVGSPRGSRAVGLANGRNPIPVIIPCHRVIGADGSLTGYGGGMERKRRLLDLEQRGTGATLF